MLAKFDSDKLRVARRAKKITQEHLAEQVDSSPRYIGALERGENDNPAASLVCRMSKALDVPMEALMIVSEEDEGSSVK